MLHVGWQGAVFILCHNGDDSFDALADVVSCCHDDLEQVLIEVTHIDARQNKHDCIVANFLNHVLCTAAPPQRKMQG
ncbi:MAG: hypothetical protein ACK56F_29280 [bacterium]